MATASITGPATASTPATRAPQPASSTNLGPGTTYIDQAAYLGAKADPEQLKRFIKDWINLGGRGIIGGDGKPASYWDVYMDLANSGIDVSDLPKPETLPQGQTKGGGGQTPLVQPAPAAAASTDTTSPELTNLLSSLGINYEKAPAASPGLLAFLRGVQGSFSTAEQTRLDTQNDIRTKATTGREDINRTYNRNQTNITADLVRRGVLQSGEATGRYARSAEDKAAKLTDLSNTETSGIKAADNVYNTTADALRRQALEQVIGREQELATAAGQSAAQQQAIQAAHNEAELAYQRQQKAQKEYQDWVEEQAKKGLAVG